MALIMPPLCFLVSNTEPRLLESHSLYAFANFQDMNSRMGGLAGPAIKIDTTYLSYGCFIITLHIRYLQTMENILCPNDIYVPFANPPHKRVSTYILMEWLHRPIFSKGCKNSELCIIEC